MVGQLGPNQIESPANLLQQQHNHDVQVRHLQTLNNRSINKWIYVSPGMNCFSDPNL